jgi:hypothetical protein
MRRRALEPVAIALAGAIDALDIASALIEGCTRSLG